MGEREFGNRAERYKHLGMIDLLKIQCLRELVRQLLKLLKMGWRRCGDELFLMVDILFSIELKYISKFKYLPS